MKASSLLVGVGLLLAAVLPVRAQSCGSVAFGVPPSTLFVGQTVRWANVFTFTPSAGCGLTASVTASPRVQFPTSAIDFPYSCVGAGSSKLDCSGTSNDPATLDTDLKGLSAGPVTLTVTVNGQTAKWPISVVLHMLFLPVVAR